MGAFRRSNEVARVVPLGLAWPYGVPIGRIVSFLAAAKCFRVWLFTTVHRRTAVTHTVTLQTVVQKHLQDLNTSTDAIAN